MHFLIPILMILLSTRIEKQIFCYQFPKQKKIYYHIFHRLIPFPSIRRLFYYHKGGFYHYDRYRKGTLAGPAPIGGSPNTEPRERAKGTNPQAHSDRGNSRKGAAGGANDGAADIGGLSITKNTTERLKHSEGLRATGDLLLFPEGRTYSPPARGRRWYPSRWSGTRALRGGCGSCGSLWTMPHFCGSAVIVHTGRSRFLLETTAALPAQTCHRQLCRRDGRRTRTVHFLFCERETEKGAR